MKVVSGGQTGADRGGLDAAIELGVPHGGWCPRGRRAEDGAVPARYVLEETPTDQYDERTGWNVADSDATALFTRGEPDGGSACTVRCARWQRRPLLHVDLERHGDASAAALLARFLEEHEVEVLNVAGNRESKAPGIQARVRAIVRIALGSSRAAQGALFE